MGLASWMGLVSLLKRPQRAPCLSSHVKTKQEIFIELL